MAKRFFLFFVTIGLICSLAGLSACKSPSSPSGGNPQPVKYTVVYMNGETKVGEQTYTANSVIDWSEITPTAPDGKEFAYWCTDLAKPEDTKISEGYKVTSNITLYAYFENAATPEETFTVKFVNDDGSTVVGEFKDKTTGTEITVPAETPVSTKGYDVFDGWYLNGDMKSPVTGTYTVKAEEAQEGVITIKAVYKQTVHVEKIVSGTETDGATWFWGGSVKVFAFVTGGSYREGLWVPVTNHVEVGEGVDPTNFDAKIVLYPDWEKFYLVRTNSETTEPDLSMLVDGAGKIYNKTDDVDNPKTEGSPVAISTPINVFDFVSPGYLEVRIDHIKDSVGIQTGEEGNFMFYVAGSIGEESKDCWVKPVAVYNVDEKSTGARFVLKVSDMNAGLGEGSSITLFILTELTNPSGESVWGNVAYQTDDMNYNPVASVYYPDQWNVHQ